LSPKGGYAANAVSFLAVVAVAVYGTATAALGATAADPALTRGLYSPDSS